MSLKRGFRRLHNLGQRLVARGEGVVLMFHSVPPTEIVDGRLIPIPSMECTPAFLEQVIDHFEGQGHQFISLDELASREREGRDEGPFVCVTFDDGYLDNFTRAYPVLKRQGVPFTIFVITGFPDGAVVHYGAITHDWVIGCDALRFSLSGQRHALAAQTPGEKIDALKRVRGLMSRSLTGPEIKTFLEDSGAPMGRHAMGWEEISALAMDDLATLGAHTINHPKLTAIKEAAVREEIQGSKDRIEAMTGEPVKHFAYPFGAAGARESAIARAIGFETISTVKPGRIALGRTDLSALPRVRVEHGRLDLLITGLRVLSKQIKFSC